MFYIVQFSNKPDQLGLFDGAIIGWRDSQEEALKFAAECKTQHKESHYAVVFPLETDPWWRPSTIQLDESMNVISE